MPCDLKTWLDYEFERAVRARQGKPQEERGDAPPEGV